MLKVVGASWSQIKISTFIIIVVLTFVITTIVITETRTDNEDGNFSATVYWTDELGFTFDFWGQGHKLDEIPKGVARAHYDPHIYDTGWAIFQVETVGTYKDHIQAYGAGLLEGVLTWQMIYWHWQNTVKSYCAENGDVCMQIRLFLEKNLNWVRETATDRQEDPYWHQVYLFYMQLEGIHQGFKKGVIRSRQDIEEIQAVDFVWMNVFSDLVDLEQKFTAFENTKWHSVLKRHNLIQARPELPTGFDCGYKRLALSSALIKFLPHEGGLLIGHNSAGSYSQMLKVFKKYEFQFHLSSKPDSKLVPGTRMSFSSYPGAIHSMDDFYVIDNPSGHSMVVAATPVTVYNNALWHNVNHINQVLIGPRATAASRLASNPQTWSSTFSRFNSGTGNKEWMIVDMGLFNRVAASATDGQNGDRFNMKNLKNLLWVLEQIPGNIVARDQTEVLLNTSYWAGYGIPFYEDIFIDSGTERMELAHGKTFSYNETALANIFRRDQVNVTNMSSMMKLMRSNMYKIDPLSEGNPRCAIGSRGDVKGSSADPPEPVGVTDMKILQSGVASAHPAAMMLRNSTFRVHKKTLRLLIAAGPVFSENSTSDDMDDMTPFSWADCNFPNTSHIGHPDVWTFQPISIDFI